MSLQQIVPFAQSRSLAVEEVPLDQIMSLFKNGQIAGYELHKRSSYVKVDDQPPQQYREMTLVAQTKDGRTYRSEVVQDNQTQEILQA